MIISIIIALLVFMIIIVVHEWGHFIAARCCGVEVEEFACGMGPKLLGHTSKKGTLYSLRALPIGGYCRMKGEEEAVKEEGSFSEASVLRRIIICAAGPVMNFVLAMVLILIFAFAWGYTDTAIISVEEDYPSYAAGIEAGDRILAIDGQKVHVYAEFSFEMSYNEGETVSITVRKASGEKETYEITPKYDEDESRYRLGFTVGTNGGGIVQIVRENGIGSLFPTIGRMIRYSFFSMCFDVELVVRSFVMLLTGQIGLNSVSGPIGIVSVIGESYRSGIAESILSALSNVSSMVVLLSANLGVLNLFPIPALDGSRIVFLVIEKIRGKKMNENVEGWIYTIGFILLMLLMVVIAINDIRNLF